MAQPGLEELQDSIVDVLSEESAVAAAYLYGSTRRESTTPQSDVDLALVLDNRLDAHERGTVLRRVTMLLSRACPGSTFDARCLDELPAAIAGRVVTEGLRVFERDPVRRVAAEVRARMLYHDFLPFERLGESEGFEGLRRQLGVG
jgi:predicted nucleotidyltransferase